MERFRDFPFSVAMATLSGRKGENLHEEAQVKHVLHLPALVSLIPPYRFSVLEYNFSFVLKLDSCGIFNKLIRNFVLSAVRLPFSSPSVTAATSAISRGSFVRLLRILIKVSDIILVVYNEFLCNALRSDRSLFRGRWIFFCFV